MLLDALITGTLGALYGLGIAASAAVAYHLAHSETVRSGRKVPTAIVPMALLTIGLSYRDVTLQHVGTLVERVTLYTVFFGVAILVGYLHGAHQRDQQGR